MNPSPTALQVGRGIAAFLFALLPEVVSLAASFPEALPSPALHNLFRVSTNLYSGGSPDHPAAFAELKKLGVTTIVSVDGARPDVEAARKHGLRYLHLPVGYDGISPARAAQLVNAAHAAPGALYVHCHHGKHRGPSAAAILGRDLAGWTTNQAVAWLRQAGTSPEYPGLYRSVVQFIPPDAATLASAPPSPEVAPVSTLVETMVAIDTHSENLKAAQKTGWKTIPGHPDLEPRHEATLLWEQFRELGRQTEPRLRPEDFRTQADDSERAADALRTVLAAPVPDPAQADTALRKLSQSCGACHQAHRN